MGASLSDKARPVGIDFGTTNSSVAVCVDDKVKLLRFPFLGGFTESYRSLLYLEQLKKTGRNSITAWTGPAGIERFLERETAGRLMQSLKSFLTSRTLLSTDVFGKRFTIEELIARVLRDLRERAQDGFGFEITSAVAGRPVQFVGAESEADNVYAEGRLREAFRLAGFTDVAFEMEPVAAAHYYESTLVDDELILIGDFGGGTSDFSLIRVGPSVRDKRSASDLLGNSGVGVAGDAFDAKIVRHLVSPYLGAGSRMRSLNKELPVPNWVYAKLERWHHLSFLKAKDTMNMLASVQRQALEPDRPGRVPASTMLGMGASFSAVNRPAMPAPKIRAPSVSTILSIRCVMPQSSFHRQHAVDGQLGPRRDDRIDNHLMSHGLQGMQNAVQGDALHMRTQIAGAHEFHIGIFHRDIVAHRAFRHQHDVLRPLLADIGDHSGGGAREIGFGDDFGRAFGMSQHHDAGMGVVLGAGANHGRAADIDVLDGVFQRAGVLGHGGLEGVQIDHHHVDGLRSNHLREPLEGIPLANRDRGRDLKPAAGRRDATDQPVRLVGIGLEDLRHAGGLGIPSHEQHVEAKRLGDLPRAEASLMHMHQQIAAAAGRVEIRETSHRDAPVVCRVVGRIEHDPAQPPYAVRRRRQAERGDMGAKSAMIETGSTPACSAKNRVKV